MHCSVRCCERVCRKGGWACAVWRLRPVHQGAAGRSACERKRISSGFAAPLGALRLPRPGQPSLLGAAWAGSATFRSPHFTRNFWTAVPPPTWGRPPTIDRAPPRTNPNIYCLQRQALHVLTLQYSPSPDNRQRALGSVRVCFRTRLLSRRFVDLCASTHLTSPVALSWGAAGGCCADCTCTPAGAGDPLPACSCPGRAPLLLARVDLLSFVITGRWGLPARCMCRRCHPPPLLVRQCSAAWQGFAVLVACLLWGCGTSSIVATLVTKPQCNSLHPRLHQSTSHKAWGAISFMQPLKGLGPPALPCYLEKSY